MSTLSEVEKAAEALPVKQREELLVFLADSLRAENTPLPAPREFSREQIQSWIEDDERGAAVFAASTTGDA